MKEIFNYKGNNITFEFGNGDVMINLTEVAKSFPKKNLSQIVNSKEITDYVNKLAAIRNYIAVDLLKVDNGNGTWAHQRVALRVAQKLSTEFAIWCDEKIEEVLTKGYTSINKPTTSVQMFAMQAQINVDFENRFNQIEDKVDLLFQKQQEAESELKALPIVSEVIPEMALRDKVRLLVNRYCSATGAFQKSVWDNIYQTLLYNYHISIKSYNKTTKESWLDVADRRGFIDKIYIIISNMLRDKNLSSN